MVKGSFKPSIIKSAQKTLQNIKRTFPVLIGIVLLIGLVKSLISTGAIPFFFTGNVLVDSVIGAGFGSVLAGNPITSYILSGEFLKEGASIAAVTAFLISWVTVGIVQFPAESMILGKRFAIVRNALAFLSAILIGIIIYLMV